MEDTPERHRPLERRTAARTAVVWESVQRVLGSAGDQQVVDIGGGTGGFAVRLAGAGHRVTVVDPSPDALAALSRRAAEADVAERVDARQGDLGDLLDLVPERSADLVLCHGVLGIVDDPVRALGTIGRLLRGGGTLSLLVAQRHAAVLARAMGGHFASARAALDGEVEGAERRFTAPEITDLVRASGLVLDTIEGVRVFADLVPGSLLDLERAVAGRTEYLTLAAQLHVLATG